MKTRRLFVLGLFLAFILLSEFAGAQLSTWEQIPSLVQCVDAAAASVAPSVSSGDVLLVGFHARNATTATIADTQSLSWNTVFSNIVGNDGRDHLWIYLATASSTGTDTITITPNGTTDQYTVVCEWRNVTATVDASANSTTAFTSGAATVPTITTTKYRDLILHIVGTVGNDEIRGPAAYSPIASSGNGDLLYMEYLVPTTDPGALGTVTINDANSRSAAVAILALRASSSLTVSTPSIPDAVSGQTYSSQMGAKGGAGGNSWSLISGVLPVGLSLSSAGVISGTPLTTSHPSLLTFQVADSASATATATLSLAVATSANTVSVATAGGTNGGSVTAGQLLVLVWNKSNNWVAGKPTDTLGTDFWQLPGTGNCILANSCLIVYAGVATSTGTDTAITTPGFPAAPNMDTLKFTNVQSIWDATLLTKALFTASETSISGTYVAPVAETLVGVANLYIGGTGTTLTVSSPFTSQKQDTWSGGIVDNATLIGASAGSNTATWSITNSTSSNRSVNLFGLRPTSSGTAPAQVPSSAQVY